MVKDWLSMSADTVRGKGTLHMVRVLKIDLAIGIKAPWKTLAGSYWCNSEVSWDLSKACGISHPACCGHPHDDNNDGSGQPTPLWQKPTYVLMSMAQPPVSMMASANTTHYKQHHYCPWPLMWTAWPPHEHAKHECHHSLLLMTPLPQLSIEFSTTMTIDIFQPWVIDMLILTS